ncbi:transposable element Tcb1 transposase [Trichonephila clavipes]|nr:transposable element Tcb1 transposase [Trichonephila clavipes]
MNYHTACQTLPWPARSPDLSPIEHALDMMGRRLHLPGNVHDLTLQLEQIWQEILQETIRRKVIAVVYWLQSRARGHEFKSPCGGRRSLEWKEGSQLKCRPHHLNEAKKYERVSELAIGDPCCVQNLKNFHWSGATLVAYSEGTVSCNCDVITTIDQVLPHQQTMISYHQRPSITKHHSQPSGVPRREGKGLLATHFAAALDPRSIGCSSASQTVGHIEKSKTKDYLKIINLLNI